MKLAVFGLGKLGCVLAAIHAARGHEVVGIDVIPRPVELINSGIAPALEPGLQELIDDSNGRLSATTEAEEALVGSDGAYIIVPTPSDDSGAFSNEYILTAVGAIGRHLREAPRNYTVVIASTVMPGSCEGPIRSLLEVESGLTVGKEIGLVYSPEFIALGSIVKDMSYPDLTLIGESHSAAGDFAISVANTIVQNSPVVRRMSLSSAEVAKISINTFVTTKISFANMLSEICDRIPGANVDDVTGAVGADSRVGTKYLKGALGYGGPCFPRDNRALSVAAMSVGVAADIATATDLVNDRQVQRMSEMIASFTQSAQGVGVLGLAYKQSTPVCEKSQSVDIANALALKGISVNAHDPLVQEDDYHGLISSVNFHSRAAEAIASTQVVVLTQDISVFDGINWEDLYGKVVVDVWGMAPNSLVANAEVIRPGNNR